MFPSDIFFFLIIIILIKVKSLLHHVLDINLEVATAACDFIRVLQL